MTIQDFNINTETKVYEYDVAVAGGGIAGIAAAVAAARGGAKTILLEKSYNLGGLATCGLISWYEPLCDGKGKQMIFGIAEELIRLSGKYGFENLPEVWGGDGLNKPKNQRFSTYYSPTVFSAALDEYVIENNVDLRFDTRVTYPVMKKNLCEGLLCESVNGSEYFKARVIIDASGDATVCHRAGIPTVEGKNYMTYICHFYNIDTAKKLCEDGDVCAFRKWMNTGSDMFGNGHPKDMELISGVSAELVTKYMTEGKKSLLKRIKEFDKNSFDVMSIPQMPQLRTVRRIVGKSDFCAVDGQTFSDSIGCCGDFRPNGEGKHYQIPFGALYNEAFPNLLACGRIISSPQGDGWEVARVIPTCAQTGEAAGKAAAKCVKNKCLINELKR